MSETKEFTQGQTVTITRGKHRGQDGRVVTRVSDQYVIETVAGAVLASPASLKAPDAPTFTIGEVAKIVAEARASVEPDPDMLAVMDNLIRELDTLNPSFSSYVSDARDVSTETAQS